MLHEFLTTNRAELIGRCRAKVARRCRPEAALAELEHGIPLFLDQLVETLRAERTVEPVRHRNPGEPENTGQHGRSEIGAGATRNGRDMSKEGFTIDEVVHNYGDFCQAVTELAIEDEAPIAVDEFKTLNRCLDDAIADAVAEFSFQRDTAIVSEGGVALDERLRLLAQELRSHIKTATLAVTAIKEGAVGLKGATGTLLDLSLMSLRNAIDRSLADAWATAGLPARHHLVSLADLMAQVKIATAFEARTRGCTFTVADVDPELVVDADSDLSVRRDSW